MITFEILKITPETIWIRLDENNNIVPIPIDNNSKVSSMYDIITNYKLNGVVT